MNHLQSAVPIVAAPMAGVTTTTLAKAAADAGAFPFLYGGYKPADALAAEITQARTWQVDFGVNLFVPGPTEPPDEVITSYASTLQADFDRYGLPLPQIHHGDRDGWEEKVEMLLAGPVPVVSFTFALPAPNLIQRFRDVGTTTIATVTTLDEARAAETAGIDALIVQGPRAGGHSATWDPDREFQDISTADLVRSVRAETDLPIIGTGGVGNATDVRDILQAGAQSVAIGTLLMRCPEAGTSSTHAAALGDPRFDQTTLTRAFTGRPARALTNEFIRQHDPEAITAYPAVHHLTKALRSAAAKASDPDWVHLWAGTGYRNATTRPAAEVIADLADD